jgi:tetratricopeptide (TPR) repeat protein
MRSILVAGFLFVFLQDDKAKEEYKQKLAACPQNAKGYFDLAKWCEGKKLKAEAEAAYEKAIELDSNFEPARKALGQKKVLGRWVSDKLYADPKWWAHPRVEQKKVDEAIVKGVNFLLNNVGKFPEGQHTYGGAPGARIKTKLRYDELVFLTCLESGWDRNDPRMKTLEQKVLSNPMDLLYHVVLKAMCLAELDPMKYQQQLAQCAQYLVDNQNPNGGWSYGQTVQLPPSFPAKEGGPIVIETGQNAGPKAKPPKQVEIKKGKDVSEKDTDASNSQYAALGIRACLSGLVVVPKETIAAAEAYWEKKQDADGGWGYCAAEQGRNPPNFNKNPLCCFGAWKHYWYYAVERAGRLLETETFGSKEWYPDGANTILGKQKPEGNWPAEVWEGIPAGAGTLKDIGAPGCFSETCFCILFLRRATPKLDETIQIKTGGSAEKK